MQLKYTFEVTKLDDYTIAVPVGNNIDGYAGVIRLNETAAFILDLLKEETSEEAVVEAMEKEYDAPRAILESEVKRFIKDFAEKGMLLQ